MRTAGRGGLTAALLVTARALPLVSLLLVPGSASGEKLGDCGRMHEQQRREARRAADQESAVCAGDRQCVAGAQARFRAALKEIDGANANCIARVRRAERAEPPPYAGWKPGDPSPVAKDGRRYLMSCNGKPLGLYKPGGALEIELKQRPGNCMPVDNWGRHDLGRQIEPRWGYCRDGRWGPASAGDPCDGPPPAR